MAARRGGLVANKALARKLAALFWRVMVKGIDYVEYGLQQYEATVLETKQRSLRRLARQLGQQLVPMPTPVSASAKKVAACCCTRRCSLVCSGRWRS